MPSASRILTLGDGDSLSLTPPLSTANGAYFLPQGGTLTSVTITLASAAQGPCSANAAIAIHSELGDIFSLGPPRWVRGDANFGLRETFTWNGEFNMSVDGEKDALLAVVRNDSGASVNVVTSWSWHR